jgi:lambda family phage portal protein
LALEVIEADRLDDNFQGHADNGNEIRMGVELNSWGRPIAYYFFTYHPGDYPFAGTQIAVGLRRVRIPAEEIIHCFKTERAGQTRGVPELVTAIMRLRHMQGYEEAEVIAARACAAIMGFIESPEGEAPVATDASNVEDNQRVTEFEPGVYKYLAPGESVNVPNVSRPGGNFGPFMKMMLRGNSGWAWYFV